MFRYFKINTALVICLAFVVRLLFLNLGVFSSTFNADQLRSKHSYTLKKRRTNAEFNSIANTKDYSLVEFCEEADTEDDDQKINSPVLLSVLYSFLDKLSFIPKPNISFDRIKSELFPKRYLSLSILRI
jgi:hypothetical protein